jgi:hypothetical protein
MPGNLHYKIANTLLLNVLKTLMVAREFDSFRLATIEEIIAMKIEVISINGRKKDF